MPNIINNTPWVSQPQVATEIDWSLKPGFVLLGSVGADLVTGKSLTQINAGHLATRSPAVAGVGFKPGGGAPYASGMHVLAKQAFILSSGVSIVWVGSISQADATYSVIVSRFNTVIDNSVYAGQWRLELSATNEIRLAIRSDAGTTTTINSGLTLTVGKQSVITVTMLSSSVIFSLNGVTAAQSATPQTYAGDGGNSVQMAVGTPSAGGYLGHRYSNCALFYGVSGNPPANPWQIFKPIQRRIFVPVSAGGATTYTITAQPGSYSLTGISATLLKSKLITAQTGSYAYTGNSATITYNASAAVYTLTAQVGSYSYSGTSASISRHRNLTANAGAYSLTGTQATISRNRNLIATTGSYNVNGQQVTITRTTLTPVYTITALPGSYTLTGQAATILRNRSLTAETGAYTYTGKTVDINKYAVSAGGGLEKYLDVLAGELLILKPLGASTPAGASAWGSITGTLSAQTDLQDALDLKADVSAVPAQFNPIAGTNVTLSGTYPNITFNASGGSGATTSQISLDFGTVPVYSKAISFTDTSVTATSKIIMTPHATNDELEMDGFVCAIKCGTGTATAYIQAIPGPVTGTRLFNYTIG